MSNTSSVSNFYVGRDGQEYPIHYKSADLVNHNAPDGYVWRKGNTKRDWIDSMQERNPNGFGWPGSMWPKEDHEYDYYYADKKDRPSDDHKR